MFRDYLCLRRPLQLSLGRAKTVANLRTLFEREMLITAFHLFNHGPCHIDFADLSREAWPAEQPEAKAAKRAQTQEAFCHQDLEDFLKERFVGFPPFAGIAEKIDHLDKREGQVQFLRLLQDDLLYKKLRREGDDRAVLYQVKKGRLKVKRRSIVPNEYKFY